MNRKNQRLESLIKKHISDIIQFELRNKGVGIPTVTNVSITNDLSIATVNITFLEKDKDKALELMENSKGFIRSALAKKVEMRKVPQIIFKVDNSFEKGSRITELLKKINQE